MNPFGATVGPPNAPSGTPPQQGWSGEAAEPPVYAPPPAQPVVQAAPPQRPSTHPAPTDPEFVDPHAPRALAGFLVSYEGNELGVFFPVFQGQNLVGRKGAAPGLNIELEHGTTSSRHATLFASARPGRMKLEDMGSTNGTFVGDLMLERGKKHELKDGDVVRFGGYVTIIKIV